jgi:hypothetical protein
MSSETLAKFVQAYPFARRISNGLGNTLQASDTAGEEDGQHGRGGQGKVEGAGKVLVSRIISLLLFVLLK